MQQIIHSEAWNETINTFIFHNKTLNVIGSVVKSKFIHFENDIC